MNEPEERVSATFRTPGGRLATFTVRLRPETTDVNTVHACLVDDEYGLAGLELSGWALDIGAHIGSVAVALALDNPDLRVLAVEPIPVNADLIRENAEINDVADRIVVVDGAADGPGVVSVQITWNWRPGTEVGGLQLHGHRFIGNVGFSESDHSLPHDEIVCPAYSLGTLLEMTGADRFSFVKIDCEGCEARFLNDPDVYRVDLISGEWHPPHATPETLHAMLDKTHSLEIWGPGEPIERGHGRGFRAVRK